MRCRAFDATPQRTSEISLTVRYQPRTSDFAYTRSLVSTVSHGPLLLWSFTGSIRIRIRCSTFVQFGASASNNPPATPLPSGGVTSKPVGALRAVRASPCEHWIEHFGSFPNMQVVLGRPNPRFEVTSEGSLVALGSSVRSLRSPAPQPAR